MFGLFVWWWALRDSNPGPSGYEPEALTNWAKGPYKKTPVPLNWGFPLAPQVGLEPTTLRLTAACSTGWAIEKYKKVGIYLSSRVVSNQVFSAPMSLTSVFGMGTGGPSPQSTPTISISTDFSVKIPLYYSTLVTSCQETFGDPYRIRTDVKGVRGLCLNHLTNGPFRCSYPLSAHQ